MNKQKNDVYNGVIDRQLKLPSYAKITIFLVGFFAILTMLYIAQGIIVPIVFSLIIAIVINPIINFFVRLRINRIAAIIITLFIAYIFITALSILLFTQARHFSQSWPVLVDKFTALLNQTITSASGYFRIDPQNIHEWITKTKGDFININSGSIGKTLIAVGGWIVLFFLVPVYIFMILFYQPLLLEFIQRLFGKNNRSQVNEIITQTKKVIQRYLVGLVIEAIIMAALNTMALLILGIDYAILLGIIGAMLNVIPYIGGIIAVALPVMVALATKSTLWYVFFILASYSFIQLIDNHYIVPKIVASKVKINALFSVIVVIFGNALWGIPGMFLSIPLLAIIKLIFDHIEPMKPWGFLLGDTMPPLLNIKSTLKKLEH